jgi:ubiquinone/menaquinone biosynthesis C-methylase UbiE
MSLTESQASSIAGSWDRYAVAYQNSAKLPTDAIGYGPGTGTENDYRLLGPLSGKRFMDLGCGGGQSAIAAAKQGAVAIGVDISVEQLAFARRLLEQETDVRVELRQGDMTELAFQRADGVDVVFSAMSLQYMPDLNRVFRQVHRVLKLQGTFVFSLPHPAAALTDKATSSSNNQLSLEPQVVTIRRAYFDRAPIEEVHGDISFTEYHRTISDIFMGLVRSGYRVDAVLEPELPAGSAVPQALIVRARKEA